MESAIFLFTSVLVLVAILLAHLRSRLLTMERLEAKIEKALEEIRGETTDRLAGLELAINQLKVEHAAASIELVSLKTQIQVTSGSAEMENEKIQRITQSTQDDTWIRDSRLSDISVVPKMRTDADTWMRDEGLAKPNDQHTGQLATVFSKNS